MSLILIIDDIPAMREQYAYDLQRLGGFETATAGGGAEGLSRLQEDSVDCVILDLEMPGVDGFEVLATLKKKGLKVPVIVYTGTGSYDRCVRAVKLGAYSFISKDEPLERVVREVENALAWSGMRGEIDRLRRQSGEGSPLVGESRAALEMVALIDRLATIPSAVLISGESGTGKELVARRLHEMSPRARKPFVPVNCAALPDAMVESELFGHERGAFTGADRTRKGAFETAHQGTLFLDEIGELPLPAQAKLLRVLEDGVVTRLGSHDGRKVDTRVVAATNRDLDAEAAAGRKAVYDPRAIPAVVFTDPEIAWCGLTETEAKERGIKVKTAKMPWRGVGRTLTLGREDGLTKLVIDPQTERVLGVAFAGPGAGELIAEGVLAVEMAAVAEDIRKTIHPHPTLSETIYEVAESLFEG